MQAPWIVSRRLIVAFSALCLLVNSSVHAVDASAANEECTKLHKEILEFYRSLPTVFRAEPEEADRIARETQQTLAKCQQVLKDCKETLQPGSYAEAQYVTAKLTYILSKRYRMQILNRLKKDSSLRPEALGAELDKRFKDYLSEVHELAREAYKALPEDHPLRPRALETLTFSLHEAKEYEASEKVGLDFMKRYPDDARLDALIGALGRTYLDAGQYASGIQLLKNALRDQYASDSYPYFVETLRKLNVGKGDIAGFESTVKQGMLVFPLKQKSSRATKILRDVCERLNLYYGFWKGYGRMAAGDLPGARAAFDDHVHLINTREAELRETGAQLRPEYAIYRGRSHISLSFLDELAEQPAPRELDLMWVTDSRVLLSDSIGKVVGIIFRGVDHRRSREFMTELSHVCAVNPDFELASVHYLRRQQSPLLRQEELRQELGSLGYSGAAGFDPDAENQSLFRAYGIKIGTATLVILDRGGSPVWFMEAPRALDVEFVKSIMARVARES